MNFHKTTIDGLFLAETKPFIDDRGAFVRFFCESDLKSIIENRKIAQINHSKTKAIGAIRGLHYQNPPYAEMKLVRCIKGKVFDVALDLRNGSKTFLKYYAEELTPENGKMMIIPEGFAHGFQVLEENSELLYLHTAFYNKDSEAGIRYNDSRVDIKWQLAPKDISSRDAAHPLINDDFKGITI